MNKDFAVLFNIEKWLKSTADMDEDRRAWYLNLLLHQYDKDGLPNDVETLATLAGVRHSKYTKFEQVFEQEFKHKFEHCSDGKLRNEFMNSIFQERKTFKENRSRAGKFSYILKLWRNKYGTNKQAETVLLSNLDLDMDIKNTTLVEHLFKQVLERLISIGIDIGNSTSKKERKPKKEKAAESLPVEFIGKETADLKPWPTFDDFWDAYDKKVDRNASEKKWHKMDLDHDTKCKIMLHITDYKEAQPDKKYRKNPETYLNNKSWNDEIISSNGTKIGMDKKTGGSGRDAYTGTNGNPSTGGIGSFNTGT